jgi:NAD(P)-dependent dehydrogenase (short-subunit alcohol dehydrogenase family)
MAVNVRSVFFGMKHEIPALLQSGGGAIVNNASLVGLRPNAGSSPGAAFITGVALPVDGGAAL